MTRPIPLVVAAALAVTAASVPPAFASRMAATTTGTSSSAAPYLVPVVPGVSITSLLTVGDSVGGYRMAGIPDGMGAYDNHDGTFTLIMAHELGASAGAVHAHGSTGAFVARYIIDKKSLKVLRGEDVIKRVFAETTSGWTPVTTAFSRFCSGDLPAVSAFYDATSRLGTTNRIFMNGEESGAEGRAIAHVVSGPDSGSSYIWNGAGKASFENQVARPDSGIQTVVAGLDDSGGGQVYFYVGKKQANGNDIEKAGLTGGKLYGLKIEGVATEDDSVAIGPQGTKFSLVEIPGAAAMTGAELQVASVALGISSLARPEDGAWDPTRNDLFAFNTTASFTGISRTWQLDFSNKNNILAGGKARVLVHSPAYDPTVSSSEQSGPRMLDNLTIDSDHTMLLQEDPGNQAYLAGIYRYRKGAVTRIVENDPARYVPGAASFVTQDEESSGIFPVPFLGEGKYLVAQQTHKTLADPELVEGGQLLLLDISQLNDK